MQNLNDHIKQINILYRNNQNYKQLQIKLTYVLSISLDQAGRGNVLAFVFGVSRATSRTASRPKRPPRRTPQRPMRSSSEITKQRKTHVIIKSHILFIERKLE